jgi:GalNAc-alpha-(1->4)-GalNAc-alpha-(1->3)-diNAcBac-PP-undecaprenol alpha-1,4-N-acetyl-D-galactosaminyltransferase
MRLTLVISGMSMGGAQRVITTLVNYWTRRGWKITLLTLDDGSIPPFYELDKSVTHIASMLPVVSSTVVGTILNKLRRVAFLRKTILESKPNVIITVTDVISIYTLIIMCSDNIPIIVSVHTDPSLSSLGWLWESLRVIMYPWASKIVVLTDSIKEYFPLNLRSKISVIPNPVLQPQVEENILPIGLSKPCIISVGRLAPEKGFDLLIEAFAELAEKHSNWSVVLLGDGEQRKTLELQIEKLNLKDRVFLLGAVQNPNVYLLQADLFVLSSHYEGFPMALCEAMACRLPVIATACGSGPCEIIREKVNGILIPPSNISELVAAMDYLMSNPSVRELFSTYSSEVVDRFSLDKVSSMWEALINDTVKPVR